MLDKIRRKEPKSKTDVRLRIRFYAGLAYGVILGGCMALGVWATKTALDGQPDWAMAAVWIVPIVWGTTHRLVMIPISKRAMDARVGQKRRRSGGRKGSTSHGTLLKRWARSFRSGIKAIKRGPDVVR